MIESDEAAIEESFLERILRDFESNGNELLRILQSVPAFYLLYKVTVLEFFSILEATCISYNTNTPSILG